MHLCALHEGRTANWLICSGGGGWVGGSAVHFDGKGPAEQRPDCIHSHLHILCICLSLLKLLHHVSLHDMKCAHFINDNMSHYAYNNYSRLTPVTMHKSRYTETLMHKSIKKSLVMNWLRLFSCFCSKCSPVYPGTNGCTRCLLGGRKCSDGKPLQWKAVSLALVSRMGFFILCRNLDFCIVLFCIHDVWLTLLANRFWWYFNFKHKT